MVNMNWNQVQLMWDAFKGGALRYADMQMEWTHLQAEFEDWLYEHHGINMEWDKINP